MRHHRHEIWLCFAFLLYLIEKYRKPMNIHSTSTCEPKSAEGRKLRSKPILFRCPGTPVIMCGLNRMRQICALFITLSPLWAQFPRPESASDRNPFAGQPEAVAAGRKLFATSCSACHGANGEGGRGPNLTTGRAVRRLNDKGMFTTSRSGVPGTDMPPTNLPDDETWRLVAFVRDLSAPAYESQVPGDVEAGAAVF